jgi:YHS domain-containing protein
VLRLLALAVLAILVYLVLRATLRAFLAGMRGTGGASLPRPARDELVKDPVCETYIPRRKAIARATGAGTRYFCSAACADRFAARG